MTEQIKLDAIAGHESAIANYNKAIAELQSQENHWFVDFLIVQYCVMIEILTKELVEMKANV
jgi:hypothetical protein